MSSLKRGGNELNLHGVKIRFCPDRLALYHIREVISQIEKLIKAGTQVFPIISPAVNNVRTRFGEAKDIKERLKKITGNKNN